MRRVGIGLRRWEALRTRPDLGVCHKTNIITNTIINVIIIVIIIVNTDHNWTILDPLLGGGLAASQAALCHVHLCKIFIWAKYSPVQNNRFNWKGWKLGNKRGKL